MTVRFSIVEVCSFRIGRLFILLLCLEALLTISDEDLIRVVDLSILREKFHRVLDRVFRRPRLWFFWPLALGRGLILAYAGIFIAAFLNIFSIILTRDVLRDTSTLILASDGGLLKRRWWHWVVLDTFCGIHRNAATCNPLLTFTVVLSQFGVGLDRCILFCWCTLTYLVQFTRLEERIWNDTVIMLQVFAARWTILVFNLNIEIHGVGYPPVHLV